MFLRTPYKVDEMIFSMKKEQIMKIQTLSQNFNLDYK